MATPGHAAGRGYESPSEGGMVEPGERFGQGLPLRDDTFGVLSVLYHALQGAETIQQYVDDARESGDEDLIEFFDECAQKHMAIARRAKMLLADRLMEEDEEDDPDARPETD